MRSTEALRRGLRRLMPGTSLRGRPRPLIDPDGRFAVFWSPKSACTTTAIWFFNVLGLLDEAQAISSSAHGYRTDEFYKSDRFRKALKTYKAEDLERLRVFRDPYSRAASSFRHVMTFGLDAEPISSHLGRAVNDEAGYTFREYLDFLEAADINKINSHHRVQIHAVERKLPSTTFINISKQDLFTELNAFEQRLGLPATDFTSLRWAHESESRRKRPPTVDVADAYDMPLTRDAGRGRAPWPSSAALLTEEARARIRKIYADDFEYFAPYL